MYTYEWFRLFNEHIPIVEWVGVRKVWVSGLHGLLPEQLFEISSDVSR